MAQRLAKYIARQPEPRWGSEYAPAIRATPQEAPRISRPTILTSGLLGRELHLLSTPEAHAALLALHHPALLDLHEQKILSCVPDTHPLFSHPLSKGVSLPGVHGTLKVAERLGVLARHPKFFINGHWVPFPYIGDLLLYLADEEGPYAVNWTVKLTPEDFLHPGPRPFGRVRRRRTDTHSETRHELEAEYYADAGIRTVRVSGSKIDRHLAANLRELFGWHRRTTTTTATGIVEAFARLQEFVGTDIIALNAVRSVSQKMRVDEYQIKILLHQFIWRRQLRVDLYRPFLMNRPVHQEILDPIIAYHDWFKR